MDPGDFCLDKNVTYEHRVDNKDAFNWCLVPNGGMDAVFFAGLSILTICLADPRYDAIVVLFWGGFYQIFAHYFNLGHVSNASSLWLGIRPADIFVYVFLPPFLTDSAVKLDFFKLKKVAVNVFFLAFVMVAASALIMIPFCLYALDLESSGWTAGHVALFGTMIASTDAASVSAVLRQGGAPDILSVILEGESLLNDATSLTLFSIFQDVVESSKSQGLGNDIADITILTLWSTFTGICIGVAFGIFNRAIFKWLQYRNIEPHAEVAFTVAGAYLSFYVTQVWCQGSGCIASVAFGLYGSATLLWGISTKARRSEMFMQFWTVLIFIVNGLIFFYVGAASVNFTIRAADVIYQQGTGELVEAILYKLPFIFLFSFALRGIFCYSSFKALKLIRLSQGATWQQVVFLTVGGLRGSLSLVLAAAVASMAVTNDQDRKVKAEISMYTAGYVIMTLLINAPLCGPLITALKLNRLRLEQIHMRRQVKDLFKRFTASSLEDMRAAAEADELLEGVDWAQVQKQTDFSEKLDQQLPERQPSLAFQRMSCSSLLQGPGGLLCCLFAGPRLPAADSTPALQHNYSSTKIQDEEDVKFTTKLTVNEHLSEQNLRPGTDAPLGRASRPVGRGSKHLGSKSLPRPEKQRPAAPIIIKSDGPPGSQGTSMTALTALRPAVSSKRAFNRSSAQTFGVARHGGRHLGGHERPSWNALRESQEHNRSNASTPRHLATAQQRSNQEGLGPAALPDNAPTNDTVSAHQHPTDAIQGVATPLDSAPGDTAENSTSVVDVSIRGVVSTPIELSDRGRTSSSQSAMQTPFGRPSASPSLEHPDALPPLPRMTSLQGSQDLDRRSTASPRLPSIPSTAVAELPPPGLAVASAPTVQSGPSASHAAVMNDGGKGFAGAPAPTLSIGILGRGLSMQRTLSPTERGPALTSPTSPPIHPLGTTSAHPHAPLGTHGPVLVQKANDTTLQPWGSVLRPAKGAMGSMGDAMSSLGSKSVQLYKHAATSGLSASNAGGLTTTSVNVNGGARTSANGQTSRRDPSYHGGVQGGPGSPDAMFMSLPEDAVQAITGERPGPQTVKQRSLGTKSVNLARVFSKNAPVPGAQHSRVSINRRSAGTPPVDMAGGDGTATGGACHPMLAEFRIRLLTGLKQHFKTKLAAGSLSPYSYLVLNYAVDVCADDPSRVFALWDEVRKEVSSGTLLDIETMVYFKLKTAHGNIKSSPLALLRWTIGPLLAVPVWLLRHHLSAISVRGLEAAVEVWNCLSGSLQTQWLQYSGHYGEMLLQEVQSEASAAWQYIIERRIDAPEKFQAIQTHRAAIELLTQQYDFIQEMNEGGMIQEMEGYRIQELIRRRLQLAARRGPVWTRASVRDILANCTFLRGCHPGVVEWMRNNSTFTMHHKGDRLFSHNLDKKPDGMIVVVSGIVRVELTLEDGSVITYYVGSGGSVGLPSLMVDDCVPGITLRTAHAESNALGKGPHVVHIPRAFFEVVRHFSRVDCMPVYQQLELQLYRTAAAHVLDLLRPRVTAQLGLFVRTAMIHILRHERHQSIIAKRHRLRTLARDLPEMDAGGVDWVSQLLELPVEAACSLLSPQPIAVDPDAEVDTDMPPITPGIPTDALGLASKTDIQDVQKLDSLTPDVSSRQSSMPADAMKRLSPSPDIPMAIMDDSEDGQIIDEMQPSVAAWHEAMYKSLVATTADIYDTIKASVKESSLVVLPPNHSIIQTSTMVLIQGSLQTNSTQLTDQQSSGATNDSSASDELQVHIDDPVGQGDSLLQGRFAVSTNDEHVAPTVMVWTRDYFDVGVAAQAPIQLVAGPKGATLLVWGVDIDDLVVAAPN